MSRLSSVILAFAVAFAALILAPAFLSGPFVLYPRMSAGDALDVLTPLILLPLYWMLMQVAPDQPLGVRETAAFVVLAALWAEGHGMHLSANSIGHDLKDAPHSDAYKLAFFYDEQLSHYLWHIGVVGLSALAIWRQQRAPLAQTAPLRAEFVAALAYGFTFFTATTEAVTGPLGVPFAAGVVVYAARRGNFRRRPALAFFAAAYALALVLFAIWAAYWALHGGCGSLLPEFSDSCVGIIE